MTLIPHRARAALLSALFITLTGTAGVCLAQGPAASTAKKELVQKVLQLQQSGFEGLAASLAGQSVAQLGQQAGAFLQNRVAPEQRDALTKEIQTEFAKFGDEVVPLLRERVLKLAPTTIGPVMEEKFSEDELKQIIAALESPGFRKYMQLTPELQRTLGQKLVAETQATVEPKLKALEQLIGKKLNAAALPAASSASAAPAGPAKATSPKAAASGAKK